MIFNTFSSKICGSDDQQLNAVVPSGELKWRFRTDGVNSSPTIDIDGTVFIGSSDHGL
jgi:outer membrane protein assembly factor BamB